MEDLEEKLQAVLSDPNQMQQILALASSLGLSAPGGPGSDGGALAPPTHTKELSIQPQADQPDVRQKALLDALRPFLRPERQKKLDQAMQVARLSHLAEFALRSRLPGSESEG